MKQETFKKAVNELLRSNEFSNIDAVSLLQERIYDIIKDEFGETIYELVFLYVNGIDIATAEHGSITMEELIYHAY